MRNSFNAKYGRIAALARANIQLSNKVVWTCDPINYTEGVDDFRSYLTFSVLKNKNFLSKDDESIQITNFLTGYVDNEINMNKDGSCWNSCPDYKWAQNHRCSDGTFCDLQRRMGHVSACDGTILDCSYIESSMTICQSVSEFEL